MVLSACHKNTRVRVRARVEVKVKVRGFGLRLRSGLGLGLGLGLGYLLFSLQGAADRRICSKPNTWPTESFLD